MQLVRTWQRVARREWIGERWSRVIEKVEDRTLDRPSQSLGKCLDLLPRLLRKRICRSGTNSPRLDELLAREHPSLVAGSCTAVCVHKRQRNFTCGLAAQSPQLCLHGVELGPRNRDHLGRLAGHARLQSRPLPLAGHAQRYARLSGRSGPAWSTFAPPSRRSWWPPG